MERKLPFSLASSDSFREIFQSMSEGILMVEASGTIVTANPVAEAMFGYGKNELNGVILEQLLPERYRGRHVDLRKSFYDHPEPRRMGVGRDLMALNKAGKEFPVEISLSFTHVAGSVLVMAFVSDISQRKKAEEALRHSEEQLIVYAAELEKKVQTRTEALNKTIQKLESEIHDRKRAEEDARKALEKERELNELKTKFVSIASHEFRTPLSTVLSSASLIAQYNQKGNAEKVERHVARIKSSVNHLTAILNDFLSLGKLEEGRVDVVLETIPLPEFFQEIEEETRASLKEGQRIVIQHDAPLMTIACDVRILRNILFNLLSNASKYSEPRTSIYLGCAREHNHIAFSVRDEGVGIPAEEHKHIFQRFFRASTSGNIQGTGLGLNIVKRYIDLLQGTISFTSDYGQGSTFTVRIPENMTRGEAAVPLS
jgi:PAS domain S-box-containing protein